MTYCKPAPPAKQFFRSFTLSKFALVCVRMKVNVAWKITSEIANCLLLPSLQSIVCWVVSNLAKLVFWIPLVIVQFCCWPCSLTNFICLVTNMLYGHHVYRHNILCVELQPVVYFKVLLFINGAVLHAIYVFVSAITFHIFMALWCYDNCCNINIENSWEMCLRWAQNFCKCLPNYFKFHEVTLSIKIYYAMSSYRHLNEFMYECMNVITYF